MLITCMSPATSVKLLPEIWILDGWFGRTDRIEDELFSWELEARDALLVRIWASFGAAKSDLLMLDVGDGDEGRIHNGNIEGRYCTALSKRLSMIEEWAADGECVIHVSSGA